MTIIILKLKVKKLKMLWVEILCVDLICLIKRSLKTDCAVQVSAITFSCKIFQWLKPCFNVYLKGTSLQTCHGTRHQRRIITQSIPVLIIRLYENSLYGFILVEDVISSPEIVIGNCTYKLAGITMHRAGHYCAIVFVEGNPCWYDGLRGLEPFPKTRIQEWFPVHAIYGKIR